MAILLCRWPHRGIASVEGTARHEGLEYGGLLYSIASKKPQQNRIVSALKTDMLVFIGPPPLSALRRSKYCRVVHAKEPRQWTRRTLQPPADGALLHADAARLFLRSPRCGPSPVGILAHGYNHQNLS